MEMDAPHCITNWQLLSRCRDQAVSTEALV